MEYKKTFRIPAKDPCRPGQSHQASYIVEAILIVPVTTPVAGICSLWVRIKKRKATSRPQ